MPNRKPAGIEMMPGLASGNHEKSTDVQKTPVGPDTVGEKNTRPTQVMRPP